MKQRLPGIVTLLLLGGGILLGLFSIQRYSTLWALGYLGLCLLAIILLIFSYCTKCSCRLEFCGCIFPGKLTRYLPRRSYEKYNRWDLFGVFIAFSVITLFPQYWLAKDPTLLMVFWAIILIAHLQIRLMVCRNCLNMNCGALPKKRRAGVSQTIL